jgi:hypothetical protein
MEQLATIPNESAFSTQTFEHAQRVAKMLATSDLIPKEFKGNVQNVMIALELANRTGASPLMVMQNLAIIHGKPSWSSTFIISAINSCGRYEPLKYDVKGAGDDLSCIAWTYEKGKTERVEGPAVTMKMAKAEGWVDKNGSKWKTMPELMIRYRAAAFFGRLYCPEITMGMQTKEEVLDISHDVVKDVDVKKSKEAQRIELMIKDAQTVSELESLVSHVGDDQMELFNDKLKALNNVR